MPLDRLLPRTLVLVVSLGGLGFGCSADGDPEESGAAEDSSTGGADFTGNTGGTPAAGGQGWQTGGSPAATGGSALGGAVNIGSGGAATGGEAIGGSVAAGGWMTSGGAPGTGGTGIGGNLGSGGAGVGGDLGAGGTGTGGEPGAGGTGVGGDLGAGGTGTGGDLGSGGTGIGGDVGTGGTGTGGDVGSGGAGIGGDPGSGGAVTGSGGSDGSCALPTTFNWTSTGPIIAPISDASHDLVSIKDPTIVFYDGLWHVYATSVGVGGIYGMVYLSFTGFDSIGAGTFYYMDQTPGFDTYVAAPQLFYFAPQELWYLVFQSGPPMYSTNPDPSNPAGWTRPAPFYASEPAIITQGGGWLDFWVICDEANCYMFFSDDHGRFYRSATSIDSFPNGFGDPVVVMEDAEAGRLFEACNVYKVQGADQYLALIEAFDETSNWNRYFRSWTAPSLDGPWTPLADSGTAPFAGGSNVTFDGTAWTNSISHGGLIRAGVDQTLTIDACDLRFLYQGHDSSWSGDDYNAIPWRLGLLTAVP